MNEIVFLCAIALCVVFLIHTKTGTKPEKALGFSLVEMLMALLVASLLLAALAPVMTRKMTENVHISGTGEAFNRGNYTCMYTEGADNSTLQDKCNIPSGIYAVNILAASGGGGGGGASDRATNGSWTNLRNLSGGTGASGTRTTGSFTFDGTTQRLLLELGGGGGGAGGTSYLSSNSGPLSQADCQLRNANGDPNGTNFGAYVAKEDNGGSTGVCVSLKNPEQGGDGKGVPILQNVTVCRAGENPGCRDNTNCTSGANCCWVGTTSGAYDTKFPVNGQTYSGQSRSVCQWNAANTICNAWWPLGSGTGMTHGRLPKQEELAGWANKVKMINATTTGVLNHYNSKYTGGSTANTAANATGGSYPGLQLCDAWESSKYGAAQCLYLVDGCQGASGDYCFPYGLWSSSLSSTDYYTSRELGHGSFENMYVRHIIYAFGVRCVLDKVPLFNSFSGGGGSAGAYMKVEVPEEVIREAVKRSPNGLGTVSYGVGAGGTKGTNAATTGARDGENGTSTYVSITASDGTELWYLEVPGGLAGKKGVANTNGTGTVGARGAQVATHSGTNCVYKNAMLENGSTLANSGYKTSRKAIQCNSVPSFGSTTNVVTAGGVGQDTTNIGKGVSTSGGKNTTMGNAVGSQGAGGSGVRCYRRSLTSTGVDCPLEESSYRGNGNGGRLKIDKIISYPGAGGGGGSAGMIARFDNITVSDGDSIKAIVGKGGTGGQKGRAGTNGGDTVIRIVHPTSDTTEVTKAVITIPGGVGGAVGGSANIGTGAIATGGAGGNPTRLITITNSRINNLKVNASYPVNSTTSADGIKTLKATNGLALPLNQFYKQDFVAGGNGGINTKVPPADSNSAPCGGYSNVVISYKKDNNNVNIQCAVHKDNDPSKELINAAPVTLPSRTVPQFNVGLIDQPPVAGTGGGGAAWIDADNLPANQLKGANGIGGYVYIYFIAQDNAPDDTGN